MTSASSYGNHVYFSQCFCIILFPSPRIFSIFLSCPIHFVSDILPASTYPSSGISLYELALFLLSAHMLWVGLYFTTQRCIMGPGSKKQDSVFLCLSYWCRDQHVTHSESENFGENAGVEADTFSIRPDLRGSKV